jgi:(1->4)-alpha-D-glucan 1-alpha-D-glucosylmutase
MTVPRATLRLQFNKHFTFADATALVSYFAALGVSHLYASPIMTARPGSTHGYDTIDPGAINPELGGEDGFRALVHELHKHAMGLILDIVPNHMAIGSGNAWWMDVLARGRPSRYAKYFDIDWDPGDPALRGKVLLPVLGSSYGEALTAGEISLGEDATGLPVVRYYDHEFPLAEASVAVVESASRDTFNAATAAAQEKLHRLLDAQHYRLAWWRSGNDWINWRRFFEINDLAAIRIEDDEVFEAVHATAFRLYAEGCIDGLRIDHVDGLAYPESYCRKLRARLAALEANRPVQRRDGQAYLIVEKILAADESLPQAWQTDGTTGYDFMDDIDALQHDAAGERPLTEWWQRVSGRPGKFAVEELLARRQILAQSFAAQCESAVDALLEIARSNRATRDFARPALRRCLIEILVHFPVYRIYAAPGCASKQDRKFLMAAIAGAKMTCLRGDNWLIEILGSWLLGEKIERSAGEALAVALVRFQQLTAPLCAKAVEDTAFYRYGRLTSRNDVGFDARRFSIPIDQFHERTRHRATTLPHSMLATATHDHKRGEDVRARLAVLSELAPQWAIAVDRWIRLSSPQCGNSEGRQMPSQADLAMLFQSIVGSWPIALSASDTSGLDNFAKRIVAWQRKALREAKLHTDWAAPNDAYERAADNMVSWLFSGSSEILPEIAGFADRVTNIGAVNSLSQLVVKLTAPGVPDVYQGTEFWDFSLVDPDNRSPVDFAARQFAVNPGTEGAPSDLRDVRTKQFVLAQILAVRKQYPELFADGAYLPLKIKGPLAEHVVAFARILGDAAAITVVCRLVAHLIAADQVFRASDPQWAATKMIVPAQLQSNFSSKLARKRSLVVRPTTSVGHLLHGWPVAFLVQDLK